MARPQLSKAGLDHGVDDPQSGRSSNGAKARRRYRRCLPDHRLGRQFHPDIRSGFGYIALTALVFGRWTPLGALAAALLLFGFCEEMALVLPTVNPVLPAPIMNMAPYVATIIAVADRAGRAGRVRAPKADGQPYVKS